MRNENIRKEHQNSLVEHFTEHMQKTAIFLSRMRFLPELNFRRDAVRLVAVLLVFVAGISACDKTEPPPSSKTKISPKADERDKTRVDAKADERERLIIRCVVQCEDDKAFILNNFTRYTVSDRRMAQDTDCPQDCRRKIERQLSGYR